MCPSPPSDQRAAVPASLFEFSTSLACSSTTTTTTPVSTTPPESQEPTDVLSAAFSALSFAPLDPRSLPSGPAFLPGLASSPSTGSTSPASSSALASPPASTDSSVCSDCSDCVRKSELRDIEEIHLDLIAQANGKALGAFPGFAPGSAAQRATPTAGVGGKARRRRDGQKLTVEST